MTFRFQLPATCTVVRGYVRLQGTGRAAACERADDRKAAARSDLGLGGPVIPDKEPVGGWADD